MSLYAVRRALFIGPSVSYGRGRLPPTPSPYSLIRKSGRDTHNARCRVTNRRGQIKSQCLFEGISRDRPRVRGNLGYGSDTWNAALGAIAFT